MSWLILLLAGMFEVIWAAGLKVEDLPGRPLLAVGVFAAIVLSMGLLAVSMRQIPLGTAYAVWTGVGVIGTFTIGAVFFNESFTLMRACCIVLILTGIIGLKTTGAPE